MTEGPRVNFIMRKALFDIYTWILCLSYLHEKQTSRIQSLFNPYTLSKLSHFGYEISVFTLHNRAVFRTAAGTACSYITTASWKNECQNFSYVHRSRKHWKCKYFLVIGGISLIQLCYNFCVTWKTKQKYPCETM